MRSYAFGLRNDLNGIEYEAATTSVNNDCRISFAAKYTDQCLSKKIIKKNKTKNKKTESNA